MIVFQKVLRTLLAVVLTYMTLSVAYAAGTVPDKVKYLKREQAFQFSADRVEDQILARWKIADGYYLYRERFHFSVSKGSELGPAVFPDGKIHYEKFFKRNVETYRNFVEIPVPIKKLAKDAIFTAQFQGCSDKGLCYTPATVNLRFDAKGIGHVVSGQLQSKTSAVVRLLGAKPQDSKAVPGLSTTTTPQPRAAQSNTSSQNQKQTLGELANNQSALVDFLRNSNHWLALGLFLLLGLGLTFTACVFPMLPILTSIIAGQGTNTSTRKSLLLSFTYVQGMAITYAILGVVTAAVGHSLSGFFQTGWVIALTVLVFVVLALSMFGFFELRLPSALQSRLTKLTNSQTGGTYIGAVIMGMISALVVSPCITAPLTGALIYIADSQNYVFGGFAMYLLALGMGIPLMIIATTEGRFLPKAGGWMDSVKAAFGVSLLGVAIYLSEQLLPSALVLTLWGTLAIGSGVYMGAFEQRSGANWLKFWKATGIVLVLVGVLEIIGALQGNSNPLRPLASFSGPLNTGTHMNLSATQAGVTGSGSEANANTPGAGIAQQSQASPFLVVPTLDALKAQLKLAKDQGKNVMVDLYADWCVACVELAEYTFPDPRVRKALENVVLLQFDLSDNSNPESIKVMKYFRVFGLPWVMFFDASGKEQTRQRVTGYLTPVPFVKRIKGAFGK